jgi:hypothetical protein
MSDEVGTEERGAMNLEGATSVRAARAGTRDRSRRGFRAGGFRDFGMAFS